MLSLSAFPDSVHSILDSTPCVDQGCLQTLPGYAYSPAVTSGTHSSLWLHSSRSLSLALCWSSSRLGYGPQLGLEYGPASPRHVVSLLHLHSLRMSNVDAWLILKHIRVPPQATIFVDDQICFNLGGRNPERDEFGAFFSTVPEDLLELGLQGVTSMSLIIDDLTVLTIRTEDGRLDVQEYTDLCSNDDDDRTQLTSLLRSLRGHAISPTVRNFRLALGFP